MTTVYTDLYASVTGKFATLATTNSWTIAGPNFPFTPVEGQEYYELSFVLGQPTQHFLGTNGQNQLDFAFRVLIHRPKGKGYGDALLDGEKIVEAFKRGTIISTTGFDIKVWSASILGGYQSEDGWFVTPVQIMCRAYTPN